MGTKSIPVKKGRNHEVMMASMGRRVLAFLLDFCLLAGIVGFLAVFFEQIDWTRIPLDPRWSLLDQIVDVLHDQAEGMRFVAAMAVGLGCILGALQDAGLEGTFGKRLLGLRVVDRHGERIGMAQGLWRNFWKVLLLLPMGVGSWWAGFDSMRRSMHDRLAGTWVVRRETPRGWADEPED